MEILKKSYQLIKDSYLSAKTSCQSFIPARVAAKIMNSRAIKKILVQQSLVGDSSFFELDKFGWITPLENNWMSIRSELDDLLKEIDKIPDIQDLAPTRFTQDSQWKTYFFYAYGIKIHNNCARCPETTHLIEQIPGIKTAFFAILLPHKKIPEHVGSYKGVLRYHLALKVPAEFKKCGIRVLFESRNWQEGKGIVFDDTLPHTVWNDSEEIRVVLLVEFLRPLRFPYSWFNQIIVWMIARSPFVQGGINNLLKREGG